MAQDKQGESGNDKDNSVKKVTTTSQRDKRDREQFPTKVVIRHLPPTLTAETFLEEISPAPPHDYFEFVKAETGLGQHAYSRAYFNFLNEKDLLLFQEKFDSYVFVDARGNEYPAIVELAPFQRIPKRRNRKADARMNTIEKDPEYQNFLKQLTEAEPVVVPLPETFLEEIEAREREMKANHGCLKMSTPLIDYIKRRKDEKRAAILHAREEKRKRELERQKLKEAERKKRIEREKEKSKEKQKQKEKEAEEKAKDDFAGPVKVLKNPDKERERDTEREEKSKTEPEAETRQKEDTSSQRDFREKQIFENSRFKEREKYGGYRKDYEGTKYDDRNRYSSKRMDDSKSASHDDYDATSETSRPRTSDKQRRPDRYRDSAYRGRETRVYARSGRDSYGGRQREYREPETAKDRTDRKAERPSQERSERGEKEYQSRTKDTESHGRSAKSRTDDTRESKDKDIGDGGSKPKNEVERTTDVGPESGDRTDTATSSGNKQKLRYKDRPERAIYDPSRRAAERMKEAKSKQTTPE